MKLVFFKQDGDTTEIVNQFEEVYHYQRIEEGVQEEYKKSKEFTDIITSIDEYIDYIDPNMVIDLYMKKGIFTKSKLQNGRIYYCNKLFRLLDKCIQKYNNSLNYIKLIEERIKRDNIDDISEEYKLILQGNTVYMEPSAMYVDGDKIEISPMYYVEDNYGEYKWFHLYDSIDFSREEIKKYEGLEFISLLNKLDESLDARMYNIYLLSEDMKEHLSDNHDELRDYISVNIRSYQHVPLINIIDILKEDTKEEK
jgi:hypothetical protein